jgi:site-specific DNA-methyltransferase (adenine-specific)
MSDYLVLEGDCVESLRDLPDDSVDSIVTDPPYGLSAQPDMAEVLRHRLAGDDYEHKGGGFMGKAWDSFVPGPSVWREALRVLKPGGHMLAFFGDRTFDLGVLAIRLAGFEIRGSIYWTYGSGFPKSLDVSKAIDKAAGAEREVVGTRKFSATNSASFRDDGWVPDLEKLSQITAPATDAARKWQGFGTSLKPAVEPIVLARKPFKGNVAANVLKHGTGALNIDGCRVGDEARYNAPAGNKAGGNSLNMSVVGMPQDTEGTTVSGRWPANLIHDNSDEARACFPETGASKASNRGLQHSGRHGGLADIGGNIKQGTDTVRGHNDAGGSASRFFQSCPFEADDFSTPGASAEPQVSPEVQGAEGSDTRNSGGLYSNDAARVIYCSKASKTDRTEGGKVANTHNTVKPVSLMRQLVRLTTPPGGVVLDPFCGSGSTGKAAMLEGFEFIGMERDPEYVVISNARITHAQAQAQGNKPCRP